VKSTNFATKDALLTGNPAKIIKGTEIDDEYNAIAVAVSTKADLVSPTFTGTPLAPTATPGTNTTQIATTAFVTAASTTERTATATLTNKTISADDNTLSGIAASSFVLSNASGNIDGAATQKVIPSGDVVGTTDTQTLTNKTINASQLVNASVTTAKIADANITAAKLDGAQSGSAPIYAARAWVNFDGTGAVAIRASGNVTSITDNGVGDYTINFTTAMPDANYSVVGFCSKDNASDDAPGGLKQNASSTRTSSAVQVLSTWGTGGALVDVNMVSVSIFR
jgi:hypothetical protein